MYIVQYILYNTIKYDNNNFKKAILISKNSIHPFH